MSSRPSCSPQNTTPCSMTYWPTPWVLNSRAEYPVVLTVPFEVISPFARHIQNPARPVHHHTGRSSEQPQSRKIVIARQHIVDDFSSIVFSTTQSFASPLRACRTYSLQPDLPCSTGQQQRPGGAQSHQQTHSNSTSWKRLSSRQQTPISDT